MAQFHKCSFLIHGTVRARLREELCRSVSVLIRRATSAIDLRMRTGYRRKALNEADELIAAYRVWVAAREKVARELPPLILENPNDDLIRALIVQEVAAHRDFIAAQDQANGVSSATGR